MKTSLSTCEQWHPGIPSVLTIHRSGKRERLRCMECNRVHVREHRQAKGMKTRLLSCDRWHPDQPSEITPYPRIDRAGKPEVIARCRLCHRTREQTRRREGTPQPDIQPYGVLPKLNWKAPEFLTGELT